MAETNASAVREAAALIFAAEDLLDLAPTDDLDRISAAVTQIARSAKALRANHLDDALAHVEHRAGWLASERARWLAPLDHLQTIDVSGSHAREMAAAAEALRVTAEYVGPKGLPALEGWSWWDALRDLRGALEWDPLPADWRDADDDARARSERHATAIDEIVLGAGADPVPETPDVAALRDRVRGDDG